MLGAYGGVFGMARQMEAVGKRQTVYHKAAPQARMS
jgi:hypothetical protein